MKRPRGQRSVHTHTVFSQTKAPCVWKKRRLFFQFRRYAKISLLSSYTLCSHPHAEIILIAFLSPLWPRFAISSSPRGDETTLTIFSFGGGCKNVVYRNRRHLFSLLGISHRSNGENFCCFHFSSLRGHHSLSTKFSPGGQIVPKWKRLAKPNLVQFCKLAFLSYF